MRSWSSAADEKYLELLADYAAKQIAAQRAKRENAPKIESATRARHARHVGAIVKGARRSFEVSKAHKHALLLALDGRSAQEIAEAS
ncbi:MAG: hypothetical protein QW343_02100 [Candidatus Norongarragalinales archaeon]